MAPHNIRSDLELKPGAIGDALAHHAGDVIVVHDLKGRIVDANRCACASLGYTREELLSMKVTDIEQGFTLEALDSIWGDLVPGVPKACEGTLRRKDGTSFPADVRVALFSTGERRLVIVSARNITQRRRAEEELRAAHEKLRKAHEELREAHDHLEKRVEERTAELSKANAELRKNIGKRENIEKELRRSEERYRLLVENQIDPVVKLDREGRFRFVSPSYCRLFGRTEEETIGKKAVERTFEEDRQVAEKALVELYHPPHTAYLEIQGATVDGLRWLAWSSRAVLAPDGSVDGIVSVGRDVTERKRAEEELRRERDFSDTLIRTSPFFYVALGPDGKVLMVNDTMLEVLGYTLDEIRGKHSLDGFVPPEERGAIKGVYRDLTESKLPTINEAHTITKDGRKLLVEWHGRPILKPNGDLDYFFGVGVDITERRENEKKLLRYQQDLKRLASKLALAEERERRRIAMVLHDTIGQTLALSKMKLSTLRGSLAGAGQADRASEAIELIEQAIQDTRSLTTQLSPPVLYELGLEAAIEWLLERAEQQHGLAAEFEDDSLPKPLDHDIRVVLFQAVCELLANIGKHAKAHAVKVALARTNSSLMVTVEDDGVGFDTTGIGSQWSRNGGFGLFTISERFQHLGGSFDLESEPGRGTRVTLAAPLKDGKNTGQEGCV